MSPEKEIQSIVPENTIVIGEIEINNVLQYLGTKPFLEVADLINSIHQSFGKHNAKAEGK